MSEQLTFDRKKGFVALPVEIMDFDLTPGAFRTLAELCRMANAEGFCWPSLHQLSERLGRSRSAISGYIKELRSAELVDTQEQKTANGYNYRLKYRVTFWQDWRASLTGKTAQKAERSVQPTARSIDSKKHNHINQSPRISFENLENLLREWSSCFIGAPYPLVRRTPTSALVMETRRMLSDNRPPQPATLEETRTQLLQLWDRLGVSTTAKQALDQAQAIHVIRYSRAELGQVLGAFAKDWPVHWRKPPQPDGLLKRIKALGISAESSQVSVLGRYYKRWQLAEKTLQNRSRSCSLAS